jgi:hypothetical protein
MLRGLESDGAVDARGSGLDQLVQGAGQRIAIEILSLDGGPEQGGHVDMPKYSSHAIEGLVVAQHADDDGLYEYTGRELALTCIPLHQLVDAHGSADVADDRSRTAV